jgi:hypothetical protein
MKNCFKSTHGIAKIVSAQSAPRGGAFSSLQMRVNLGAQRHIHTGLRGAIHD